jgi:hypothetical protein
MVTAGFLTFPMILCSIATGSDLAVIVATSPLTPVDISSSLKPLIEKEVERKSQGIGGEIASQIRGIYEAKLLPDCSEGLSLITNI